ncbi:hypothetical protein BHE74_00039080 [Ensete ventricosum]|uniref:Uncharacterized protein n=1 Tax=Ensete ventricosum TaxID=4639 RepID=A0A445MEL5_ENSVE|nr:hypothetical protein BHE74_00039080 [Ensete ventricosum]RZR72710.1 hypothetical protein BHM03_00016035 [Ensete ventricosum]
MRFGREVNSGTNLGDLAKRVNSSTNLRDLAERVNSGTNLGDLVERVNSGTNLRDLVEKVNSITNLGDLAERVNSSTSLGDLAERVNSGTNIGDLVERVNSGTNLGDLAERVNSGTNLEDLVKKVNSITNLGDLAERVNSSINLGDLAKKVVLLWFFLGHPPYPPLIGVFANSSKEPEASSSGASLGPLSPIDVRVLRDLKVIKVGHDLDTEVIEGSLAAIREWYNIPIKYGLHVPHPGQHLYSSGVPGVCISIDALEAGLRFSLHSTIKECLRWWGIPRVRWRPTLKTLSRRNKSRRGEEGSWSYSRGKEPIGLVKELEAPVESVEETMAPIFRRLKSMKDLCGTSVRKDDEGYYALYMSSLALQ